MSARERLESEGIRCCYLDGATRHRQDVLAEFKNGTGPCVSDQPQGRPAKDTIEEKVMALKARKAALFSSVLDGGDFSSAQLTASDIRSLLE